MSENSITFQTENGMRTLKYPSTWRVTMKEGKILIKGEKWKEMEKGLKEMVESLLGGYWMEGVIVGTGYRVTLEKKNPINFFPMIRVNHSWFEDCGEECGEVVTEVMDESLDVPYSKDCFQIGQDISREDYELKLKLGLSHEIGKPVPRDISVFIENGNKIGIGGRDKQKMGQFLAEIVKHKPLEKNRGKGIEKK